MGGITNNLKLIFLLIISARGEDIVELMDGKSLNQVRKKTFLEIAERGILLPALPVDVARCLGAGKQDF